jgi:hypothetical protein
MVMLFSSFLLVSEKKCGDALCTRRWCYLGFTTTTNALEWNNEKAKKKEKRRRREQVLRFV